MLANDETLHLIYDVLDKKGYIDIPAFGYSMYPYIQKGDLCRFIPFNQSFIEKGDVLLYINDSGQLIGHRYYDKTKEGQMYFLKGDSNLSFDPQVHVNQIIGKLTVIQRGDQVMEPSDFRRKIWSKVFVLLPILSRVLNRVVSKKRRGENVFDVGKRISKGDRFKKVK